jgi:hypothetical protein
MNIISIIKNKVNGRMIKEMDKVNAYIEMEIPIKVYNI